MNNCRMKSLKHDVEEVRYEVDEVRYEVDEVRYEVDEVKYEVDEGVEVWSRWTVVWSQWSVKMRYEVTVYSNRSYLCDALWCSAISNKGPTYPRERWSNWRWST